jgi:hypothetical protein
MGSHPANLTLRFLLELAALIAVGRWGFQQTSSWPRYALMIGLPLALAILWGVFAVPNDPSRSGNAPVPIPGGLRLLLELLVFAAGSCALYACGARVAAFTFAVVVLAHYGLSYDRVGWLLSRSA